MATYDKDIPADTPMYLSYTQDQIWRDKQLTYYFICEDQTSHEYKKVWTNLI